MPAECKNNEPSPLQGAFVVAVVDRLQIVELTVGFTFKVLGRLTCMTMDSESTGHIKNHEAVDTGILLSMFVFVLVHEAMNGNQCKFNISKSNGIETHPVLEYYLMKTVSQ